MANRLKDKVAIVTGASNGMGKGEATKFVEEGAKVVIADIQDEKGQALAKELGDNATYLHLDITKEADWQVARAEIEKKFGPVNVVVNNAGWSASADLKGTTEEFFMQMVQRNELSVLFSYRTFVPSMKENGGGVFVNVGSMAGIMGHTTLLAYSASKAGVQLMTKNGARDFAPYGIRVNCLNPGTFHTAMLDLGLKEQPEMVQGVIDGVPLKRVGEPEDAANLALFLASDGSSYLTGEIVNIDGGSFA